VTLAVWPVASEPESRREAQPSVRQPADSLREQSIFLTHSSFFLFVLIIKIPGPFQVRLLVNTDAATGPDWPLGWPLPPSPSLSPPDVGQPSART
jgi:hypothetical protein